MRPTQKKILGGLIKAAFSAVLIFLAIRRIDLSGVCRYLREADLGLLALAALTALCSHSVSSMRWRRLSGEMLSFSQALRLTLTGVFYGAIFPGNISGDVAKGTVLALKDQKARTWALPLSILLDRVIGLYVLVFFFNAGCATLWTGHHSVSPSLAFGARVGWFSSAAILILGILAYVYGLDRIARRVESWAFAGPFDRLANRIADALSGSSFYRCAIRTAAILSVAEHGLNLLMNYLLLRSLGIVAPLVAVFVLYAVLSLIVILPISISGIGLREWFSMLYFQQIHLQGEAGIAFSWLCLAVGTSMAVLGGVWHLYDVLREKRRRPVPSRDIRVRSVVRVAKNSMVIGWLDDVFSMVYLKRIKPCSTNVFLCSYPKCGRTWLRFLLTHYQTRPLNLPEPVTLKNYAKWSPNLTVFSPSRMGLRYSRVSDDLLRIIGTHSSHPCLFRGRKVIYLDRDPRDVLVSYYHHKRSHGDYEGTLEDFIFRNGELEALLAYRCRWLEALKGWPANSLLRIGYEELHSNTREVFVRCLSFCGLPVDLLRVQESLEYAASENMRKLEDQFGTYDFTRDHIAAHPESRHVRRAVSGGYREEMDAGLIERVNAVLASG